MGCFCNQSIAVLCQEQLAFAGGRSGPGLALSFDAAFALTAQARLVAAISEHLAVRWLPAALPWQPDPAWLELEFAAPPLPVGSLAVILAMVQAAAQCRLALGLDLGAAQGVRSLVRLVATLNLRMEALATLAADLRPWSALAALNDQIDSVRAAAQAGLFVSASASASASVSLAASVAIGPWRPFLAQIKALAPLIAIGQLLAIDFAEPAAFATLAAQLRLLAAIQLPALADPTVVAQVIARASAIARLTLSFGGNPLAVPFANVVAAVQLKLDAVLALLPPGVQLGPLGLTGMLDLSPNPGLLATADVVALALRIPSLSLGWHVPAFASVNLLASGSAAIALAAQLGVVCAVPCVVCDGRKAASGPF